MKKLLTYIKHYDNDIVFCFLKTWFACGD